MNGKEAIKRLEKQYKRQNEYIKNSYDRVSVTLPKGTKEAIRATGNSVNGLINTLIAIWLKDHGEKAAAPQDEEEFPFS